MAILPSRRVCARRLCQTRASPPQQKNCCPCRWKFCRQRHRSQNFTRKTDVVGVIAQSREYALVTHEQTDGGGMHERQRKLRRGFSRKYPYKPESRRMRGTGSTQKNGAKSDPDCRTLAQIGESKGQERERLEDRKRKITTLKRTLAPAALR